MACRFDFTFTGLERSARIEASVRRCIREIPRNVAPIVACQAIIEQIGEQIGLRRPEGHTESTRYRAVLDVTDSEGRRTVETGTHDHPEAAIAMAYAGLHRRIEEARPGTARGDSAERWSGHIVQLLPEDGYGVLLTDTGAQVRFLTRSAASTDLGPLHVGDRVWCVPESEPAAAGGGNARIIHVAGSGRGPVRTDNAPARANARGGVRARVA